MRAENADELLFRTGALDWQVRREYGRQFDSSWDGVAKSMGHPHWIFSVNMRRRTPVSRRYEVYTDNILRLWPEPKSLSLNA